MRSLLVLVMFLLIKWSMAQERALFIELGGNGGFASINYEVKFTKLSKLYTRVGLGVTFFEFKKEISDNGSSPGCALCGISIAAPEVSLTIPISVQYLIKLKKENYLEVGIGATVQLLEKTIYILHPSIGYRKYFGVNDNWMWKINITPIADVIGDNVSKDSVPTVWGGLSIGKRF